jgi:hypothetical protein
MRTHNTHEQDISSQKLSVKYEPYKIKFPAENSQFKEFAGLYPQHCFFSTRRQNAFSLFQNVMLMVTSTENKITLAEDGVPRKFA